MVSHMKTTLNLDDTVMAQLKREAARQGRTMSELVEMAARLRLTPAQTLRLALRALAADLAKRSPKRVGRLVGAERGALEGKR